MNAPLTEEDELAAAELALGLAGEAERQAGQARLHDDAGFADAYARWLGWAAGLFDGLAETPRPSLWRRIEASLPANDAAADMTSRLRRWQVASWVSGAVACVLAAVLVTQALPLAGPGPVAGAVQAPMVALLSGADGVVSVSYDPATTRLTVVPDRLRTGGRTPELWVIPADGRPRALGVMPADTPGWMAAPPGAAKAMGAGVTIALSLEPAGGAPGDHPTGPVILSGRMGATA